MDKKIKFIFIGIFIGYILSCIFNPDFSYSDEDNKNFRNLAIKKLFRTSSRHIAAAEQDTSSIMSLLHANYGENSYYNLRDIASDSEIEKVIKINIKDFGKKVIDIQDLAIERVSNVCPQFLDKINKISSNKTNLLF